MQIVIHRGSLPTGSGEPRTNPYVRFLTRIRIRMFWEYGRGEHPSKLGGSPAGDRRSPLRIHINFGRGIVSSADLCYHEANKKPLPLGEVAAKPTERANGGKNTPSHPLSRELSQGESLWVRATLGVWALPCAFVIQRRNWRDKTEL